MKYLVLVFCIVIASCNSRNESEIDFYQDARIIKDEEFEAANLRYEIMEVKELTDSVIISSIDFIGENFVILTNQNDVYILDSSRRKICEFKNDSLEIIGGKEIVVRNDRNFLVYDLTKNIFHEFAFDSAENSWLHRNPIVLDERLGGMMTIEYLPNNRYLATSINNIGGKILSFSLDSSQKIHKYTGRIPQNEFANKYITGMKYRSAVAYQKSSKLKFVGHYFTDLIEAYNEDDSLVFRLQGPVNFKPIYEVNKRVGQDVFTNTSDTKIGYLSLATDNKFVYALYSGKTRKEKPNDKTIYVFKKSGEPYKKIALPNNIYEIKIDENRNRLFGFKSGTISKEQIIYFNTSDI